MDVMVNELGGTHWGDRSPKRDAEIESTDEIGRSGFSWV